MTYRTKLLLMLLLTGAFITCLTATVLLQQQWQSLFEQRQSKLKTLVATGAILMPGDLLSSLHNRAEEQTPAYQHLAQMLRDVRAANRRGKSRFQIDHVYVLRLAPNKRGKIEYVADAADGQESRFYTGDAYAAEANSAALQALAAGKVLAEAGFHQDSRGRWLTAFAPLHDHTGKITGVLGADIAADIVEENLTDKVVSGLASLLFAIPLLAGCAVVLSAWVTRPLRSLKQTVQAIGRGDLAARAPVLACDEFGELALAVNRMAAGLQERERVKGAFARYVSQTVLERVLQQGGLAILKGERRRITVLFSDIRDFTQLAETRHPEEIVSLLNAYFERMIEVVFRNHGCVDKFLGDGLMVTFGAFEDDPQHEQRAINTALEMHAELQSLCAQWEAEGKPALRIGIGIHTGEAVVGEIGSSQRVEFTALGDTVNLASRLEAACKTLHVGIVISEATHAAVPGLFHSTDCGLIPVKGRTAQVRVFSIEGVHALRKAA